MLIYNSNKGASYNGSIGASRALGVGSIPAAPIFTKTIKMELSKIRKKLDKLDKRLMRILAKRMALIPDVAKYKKTNGVARYQPEREKQIIESKRKLAQQNKVNPDLAEDLFKRIIKDAHRIEENIIGK